MILSLTCDSTVFKLFHWPNIKSGELIGKNIYLIIIKQWIKMITALGLTYKGKRQIFNCIPFFYKLMLLIYELKELNILTVNSNSSLFFSFTAKGHQPLIRFVLKRFIILTLPSHLSISSEHFLWLLAPRTIRVRLRVIAPKIVQSDLFHYKSKF